MHLHHTAKREHLHKIIRRETNLDSVSRIDDKEVFCNGKLHKLSGAQYSGDFHIKLNKFYDTYLNEFSPGKSYWGTRDDVNIILKNIEKIAGDNIEGSTLSITNYGAELKLIGEDQCPQEFKRVDIDAKKDFIPFDSGSNSETTSEEDSIKDDTCIIICFSGEITTTIPAIIKV